MNGKELKVAELELKFGGQPRMVDVFGVFRYKPNNGLYVIYVDVGIYNYVCYGVSFVKNDSILCMNSNKSEDIEVIKEYIFKVTNGEALDNFEIFSLDSIKEIEIIGSKNFEIKKDVLLSLIDKTTPKKVDNVEEKKEEVKIKKKKSPVVTALLFILILVIAGSGYFYYKSIMNNQSVSRVIYCVKEYSHDDLDSVSVKDERTFKFNNYDKLSDLDEVMTYKFNSDDVYLDFINKSLYSKYMVENNDDTKGDYKIDDENKTFITYARTKIDESYGGSVEYEEILSVSKKDSYTCEEKIEK